MTTYRHGACSSKGWNSVSARAETFPDEKTTFPPGRKSRKLKKQRFRRGGNLPRRKNSFAARGNLAKWLSATFPLGRKLIFINIPNINL